jgi:hypothetical protein
VHIALAAAGGTIERGVVFPGDRERIRWQAAQAALDMVRRHFIGASGLGTSGPRGGAARPPGGKTSPKA